MLVKWPSSVQKNTSDFHNQLSLYITTFINKCIIVSHWINWPLRLAKVDQRVSWWSGGQTYYQVPLNIFDKLVSIIYTIHSYLYIDESLAGAFHIYEVYCWTWTPIPAHIGTFVVPLLTDVLLETHIKRVVRRWQGLIQRCFGPSCVHLV